MSFLWLLAELRTPFLDGFMQFITYLGQELIIIAVICTLFWCVDKRFAYLLGFTYFTAGLGVQALKITFRIPRPWVLDPDFQAVKSAIPGATGYSFPSGHTQSATALFFPLALKVKQKILKILCIFMFLIIGFSRMYLGCHTPKDVLVSMLFTIIISLIIWHFQNFFLNSTKYLKQIAAILSVLSIAVAIYALTLNKNGTIETKYAIDCCKAAGAGLGFSIGWYIERTRLNFDTRTLKFRSQIIKISVGLFIALAIKESFSLIFGSSVLAKMAEYFILVIWVLVIYPYVFTKISERRRNS
ncbi:MAG: phosphatase PAP2 family protein [Lachnospiraceae bacterium]